MVQTRFINQKEIQNINFSYIFEVDLEYAESIHDFTIDYPLAPEENEKNWIRKDLHFVIHYKTLRQYLLLGLKPKRST